MLICVCITILHYDQCTLLNQSLHGQFEYYSCQLSASYPQYRYDSMSGQAKIKVGLTYFVKMFIDS